MKMLEILEVIKVEIADEAIVLEIGDTKQLENHGTV